MPDQPRSRFFLWVVLGGGVFFLFLLSIFALVYFTVRTQQKDGFSGFGDKIGVVDLEGVIISPKDVVEQLRKYRRRQLRQGHRSARQFARRRRRSVGGDLSRGAAHSRSEEEADCGLHRDGRRQRRLLRLFGDQQDLRRQRQHRRLHWRDCRVVQLRRAASSGPS